MNTQVNEVTQRIIERSKASRQAYLAKIERARGQGPHRGVLSCGNLAHGFAACNTSDKTDLRSMTKANIAIVSSYNDMLSAHQRQCRVGCHASPYHRPGCHTGRSTSG